MLRLGSRRFAGMMYQLGLLVNAIRFYEETAVPYKDEPGKLLTYANYMSECLSGNLGDRWSPLSPPELGEPHVILFSEHGEYITEILYYADNGQAMGVEHGKKVMHYWWGVLRDYVSLDSHYPRMHYLATHFEDDIAEYEKIYAEDIASGVYTKPLSISPEALEEIREICNQ